MRIAVLTHTFFPIVGGAEVGIHEVFNRMVDDEVIVVTPIAAAPADPFSIDDPRDTGYRVHRYVDRTGRIRPRFLALFVRLLGLQEFVVLRRIHRRTPLDAVNIVFVSPFGVAALWVRLFLRVPVVTSLVGRTDVLSLLPFRARAHAVLALRAANAVTEISTFCLDGRKVNPRISVLPYGADLERYHPQQRSERLRRDLGAREDQILLVAVQRLSPVKRVDLLIDVAQELERREPGRFVLAVVGQGSELESLNDKIARQQATNVTMVGFVAESELPEVLASADVFVFHSEMETFGVVFAEAMASGTPIVAAATSAIPRVITDGVDGLLVPPADIEAFASKVAEIADSGALRTRLVEGGLATARERYDWNAVSRQLRRIFSELS